MVNCLHPAVVITLLCIISELLRQVISAANPTTIPLSTGSSRQPSEIPHSPWKLGEPSRYKPPLGQLVLDSSIFEPSGQETRKQSPGSTCTFENEKDTKTSDLSPSPNSPSKLPQVVPKVQQKKVWGQTRYKEKDIIEVPLPTIQVYRGRILIERVTKSTKQPTHQMKSLRSQRVLAPLQPAVIGSEPLDCPACPSGCDQYGECFLTDDPICTSN